MGDRQERALRVQFDSKLRLEFHGTRITSDAGLLAFRELDEAFRLSEMGAAMLGDSRTGKNTQHTLLAMLRQAVYGRLARYEDVNDAERLRVDPGCLPSDAFGLRLDAGCGRGLDVRQLVLLEHRPRALDEDRPPTARPRAAWPRRRRSDRRGWRWSWGPRHRERA